MAAANPMGGLFKKIAGSKASGNRGNYLGEGEYLLFIRDAFFIVNDEGQYTAIVELDVLAHLNGPKKHEDGEAVAVVFSFKQKGAHERLKGFIKEVAEVAEDSIDEEMIGTLFPMRDEGESEFRGSTCRIVGTTKVAKVSGNDYTQYSFYPGPSWAGLKEMIDEGAVTEKAVKRCITLEELAGMIEAEAAETT